MTDQSSVSLPIQAKVQPRQLFWNILYSVLCTGLALWGAWDYFVTIPQAEADFARFSEAQKSMEELAAVAETRTLRPDETESYLAAEAVAKEFKEPPVPPAAYDRAVQLWLYIVGCGVLGTPFFVWNLIVLPRTAAKWRLNEDGSLDTPEGSIPADQIANLDMGRWMAKSIAEVETTDGRSIKLDDYKFRGMDLIIGALAQRFAPGEWTPEAKPIPKPEVVADAPTRDEDGEIVASEADASPR
ncbi:MAG: hypothetical protein ACO38W_09480 [Phycisphaerales bacterium]